MSESPGRIVRKRASIAVIVPMLACGGSPRSVQPVAVPLAPAAASTARASVIRSRVVIVPGTNILVRAFVAGDGSEYLLVGSARATIRAGAIEWASVSFNQALVSATRVANGFVFVDADGTVAFSETFLGAPRRIGGLGGEPATLRRTRRRDHRSG